MITQTFSEYLQEAKNPTQQTNKSHPRPTQMHTNCTHITLSSAIQSFKRVLRLAAYLSKAFFIIVAKDKHPDTVIHI